jgi:plastocyanin
MVRSRLRYAVLAAATLLGLLVTSEPSVLAQDGASILATYALPDIPLAEAQAMALPAYPIADDRGFLLGGTGSDLWRAPGDPAGEFWMVTDRGPNGQIEVDGKNRRTFPVPDFTPHILHVKTEDDAVTILEAIAIVGQSGKPVTGLSNQEGHDEKPYAFDAQEELAYNPSGLDTEGLVRVASGDFWLADEYSPSIVHVDATGKVVERFVPEGLALTGADYPVTETLPAIYAMRKGDRRFEGIALAPDGKTVSLTLQSPLSNPDGDTGEASRAGRILAFDTETEQTVGEYVYQFEVATGFDPDPEVTQDDMKLSGVVAIDEKTLLILERTDAVAKLYSVDLAGATDIAGSPWDDEATAPTLEAATDLVAAGVTPLAKTLLVDLSQLDGMPGKIEGVAIVDETTVAVANDNDLDVGEIGAAGRNVGEGKKSEILLVRTGPVAPVDQPGTPVADGSPVASSMVVPVEISRFAYRPRQIDIEVGTTVVWTNRDGGAHTVTATAAGVKSGRISHGGVYRHHFTETGRVNYECSYHQNMTGVLFVR